MTQFEQNVSNLLANAATLTSIIVNCYNAEDHQDAPTDIDSATVTDTVIAIN